MIKIRLKYLKNKVITTRIKNLIWIFPYLGSLLIISGIFSPIITVGGLDVQLWIFMLKVDYNKLLNLPETMVIGGLIVTIIFCSSIPFLIIPSINYAFTKRKANFKFWLIGAFLIVLGLIIYLVQNYVSIINSVINISWNYPFQVNTTFTIIYYFLSAFLGISGYFLSRFIKASPIE